MMYQMIDASGPYLTTFLSTLDEVEMPRVKRARTRFAVALSSADCVLTSRWTVAAAAFEFRSLHAIGVHAIFRLLHHRLASRGVLGDDEAAGKYAQTAAGHIAEHPTGSADTASRAICTSGECVCATRRSGAGLCSGHACLIAAVLLCSVCMFGLNVPVSAALQCGRSLVA